MRARLLLATFALAAPAFAQVVHPNAYAGTSTTSNNAWPFGYTNGAGDYQQSYDGSQFPGPMTIAQIGFRYGTDTVRSGGTVDCKIWLSYCAGPYNALASTFATNIGVGSTVVFDGIATIPPFQGDPATPNPFTFVIPFTTPFAYDPGQGDLLMTVEMRVSGSSTWGAFERASGAGASRVYANTGSTGNAGGSVDSIGLITLFDGPQCAGRVASRGAGCLDSTRTPLALSSTGCPDRGTAFSLEVEMGASNAAPVLLMMGLSDQNWLGIQLPLDLGLFGATGCSLYVSQEALIGPLANPGGSASLQALVPNDPLLTRGTSYWQALIIDPPANSFGLVTSNLLAITIG
ncbi:MAG: hypothetical protein JNM84_13580 [Planctomycetes bacterium]|nr:hypothetical protein [Planctomycetota bacterium]